LQSPYTSSPHDAYIAAQSSVAAVLTAVAWSQRLRPRRALALIVIGLWGCALPHVEGAFLQGLGATLAPTHFLSVIGWSSTLATVGVLLSAPRWVGLFAIGLRLALAQADAYFTDSEAELACLHLVGIGLLLGLVQLTQRPTAPKTDDFRPSRGMRMDDIALFAGATWLAMMISIFVLQRGCDSADEWSYTFQASIFAKGRAYAALPPCAAAFRNFWIFWKDNRVFSQYPPGWPMFAAPFQALGAMWLAAPVTHGLLAVGVARLARRASVPAGPLALGLRNEARIAGLIGAVTVTLGSTMLINGASRFPHTFLCALFAWCVEATCLVTTSGMGPRHQRMYGALLGATSAMMLGTRPADGAFLGFGVFIYFVYALVRRRIGWRAVAAAAVAFGLVGGLVLVILRLQLGAWFKTGYSLIHEFHPWVQFAFGLPKPNEFKWHFPLATGSYGWWPCAPAVGAAGMAAMSKGRSARIVFMLSVGTMGLLGFYTMIGFGRGWDFGYGPRYQLPAVVPMALGGAVLLAPMFANALKSATQTSAWTLAGPATLTLAAWVAGIVTLAPNIYPHHYEEVRLRNVVFQAIRREGIHDAVVTVSQGSTISDQLDLTQNLPIDLYPNQDVLVVSDPSPEMHKCVRDNFPNRRFYRTVGRPEVALASD
jgi:hypothetical protein